MVGKILNLGIDLLAERFIGTSSEGAISQFKVGIGTTDPISTDTDLEIAVPINDGTANDDGSNTLTGTSGGDNTTDNTSIFKEGAGQLDVTSQNLIANGSNATKIWTISNLASLGTNIDQTQFFGLWIFIKDSTALAKFKSSGTVLEIKLGSSAGNYFSLTKEASDLAVGFNWITSNTVAVEDLTETGTVAGNVDTFIIEITTNNATDTFVAGDVIYDLLRTWETSDLIKNFETGFPAYDSSTKEIQSRMILTLSQANGFPLTEIAVRNSDGTSWTRDTYTSFSKSLTEELRFSQKDRIRQT
jgi:hypothetical protein